MKRNPRNLEERTRRVVLEKHLSHLYSRYNPHQSMTMGELERIKKLYGFTQLQKYAQDAQVFQFSIDVTGWNSRFRRRLCEPVGKIFDRWFGLPAFSKIMDAYELSYFVHPTADYRYSWEGQLGGVEGLSRYFWVGSYVGIALNVFNSLGYNYFIMDNGDDLRAAVVVPNAVVDTFPGKREVCLDIKTRLAAALHQYGHEAKITETYGSQKLIAYSKIYFFDELAMPSIYKRIAKCHGLANVVIPLLDQRIGSITSNAHSACNSSTNHVPIVFVATFMIM